MMHGHEKSDPAIVAVKPANKAERSAAELVEPRVGTEGNAGQQSTRRTQRRASVAQALERYGKWRAIALPSRTRGGSRMRESRTYGSVRGARGNSRPYRESRYIGLKKPVGAPSGPRLLKFLLLPNEMICPLLVALIPLPLRVMVSSLSTMVARGPSA